MATAREDVVGRASGVGRSGRLEWWEGDRGQEGILSHLRRAIWLTAKGLGREVCPPGKELHSHLACPSGPLRPVEQKWGWALMLISLFPVPSGPPHSLPFSERLGHCSDFVKRGIE